MLGWVSARVGIIVTGTEVISGQIADRNGPWVSDRLLALGAEVPHLLQCGDRPADMTAQLQFLADEGLDLIITTGGLGPTADDLTVATVAAFCGLGLDHDPQLADQITGIIRDWRRYDDDEPLPENVRAAVDKQALVPAGAEPLRPAGTAPGLAIPAAAGRPAVLILPGPPHELQKMFGAALSTAAVAAALAGRESVRMATVRAYGLSEADLTATLESVAPSITGFTDLEITTCIRAGELDVDVRYRETADSAFAELKSALLAEHGDQFFSPDGRRFDDLLSDALEGHSIATAESCTGGMVAARITDRAGSSVYMLGGIVSYADEVKSGVLGVPADMIGDVGAVSKPVAAAMAEGARRVTGAKIGISTTGIAGPGGAVPGKPVGTVCFGLAVDGRPTETVTRQFPGDRAAVRTLATVYALHLVYDALTR